MPGAPLKLNGPLSMRAGFVTAAFRNGIPDEHDGSHRADREIERRLPISKGPSYPESHLKRFDGVENVRECRIARWRYPGGIGVVDVVILAVQQIQGFDDKAPFSGNSITHLRIEQNRRS